MLYQQKVFQQMKHKPNRQFAESLLAVQKYQKKLCALKNFFEMEVTTIFTFPHH